MQLEPGMRVRCIENSGWAIRLGCEYEVHAIYKDGFIEVVGIDGYLYSSRFKPIVRVPWRLRMVDRENAA